MGYKIVVLGTSTIGLPLAMQLQAQAGKIGIDEIFITKKHADPITAGRIIGMTKTGIKFCPEDSAIDAFKQIGIPCTMTLSEAYQQADIVVDCTVRGHALECKKGLFAELNHVKGFIAQGSEGGFGFPVVFDVNDHLVTDDNRFLQVVSCNTHQLVSVINTIANLSENPANLVNAHCVILRRDVDFTQKKGSVSSPELGLHTDPIFGSHQARDAAGIIETVYGNKPQLTSSVSKLHQQVMHATNFYIVLKGEVSLETVKNRLEKNRLIALTKYVSTNVAFGDIRDFGPNGRCFNQSIICEDSLAVIPSPLGTIVLGWAFTPQDANSLLTSIALILRKVHGKDDYLKMMKPYLEFPYTRQHI